MQDNLEIIIGNPFEKYWEVKYDIFSEDKIDSTEEFVIKNKDGSTQIVLEFGYGISMMKFDNEDFSRLVLSIYDTDIIPEGEYYYSYELLTMSGKQVLKIFGNIDVKKNFVLDQSRKREVRPWDLLKGKDSPGGARATHEEKEKRLSICKECPRFVKLTSQCLECGCIMKLKTKLLDATCPLGKW